MTARRDIALVIIVLLSAMATAGCAQVYGYINEALPDPTPSPTPVPILSATPAPSPTPTPSPAPTQAPTQSPTPTHSPSPTPSPAPSATPSPPPSPTPTPAPEQDTTQNDIRVTSGLDVQAPAGIWDHYIAYDERTGVNSYKVHLYDIQTASDKVIASGNVRSYGCIGGNYGDGNVGLMYGDNYSLLLYNIGSRLTTLVIGAGDRPRMDPCITGSDFIFACNDGVVNGMYVINLYDYNMVTGETTTRMTGMPDPHDIRTEGSNTVWWLRYGEQRMVGMLRRDSYGGAFGVISPEGAISDKPRVYANKVVYHCVKDGAEYINAYYMDTLSTKRIPSAGSQASCDIYENLAVIDDNRDGNWNIYTYDLNTGRETRLTGEPHDQTSPMIWGGYVAYFDNRNGCKDLYVLSL